MEEGGKQGIEECLVNTESGADDHVVPTVPANKVSESTCQLFDLGYTDGYPYVSESDLGSYSAKQSHGQGMSEGQRPASRL